MASQEPPRRPLGEVDPNINVLSPARHLMSVSKIDHPDTCIAAPALNGQPIVGSVVVKSEQVHPQPMQVDQPSHTADADNGVRYPLLATLVKPKVLDTAAPAAPADDVSRVAVPETDLSTNTPVIIPEKALVTASDEQDELYAMNLAEHLKQESLKVAHITDVERPTTPPMKVDPAEYAKLVDGLDADGSPADEEENEEVIEAPIYSSYRPQKFKLGGEHPSKLVEASSLSSVSPPDVRYQLALPQKAIDTLLSSPQLEAIVYACQRHEFFLPDGSRAGYFIGDGAGVGKGRTIAGLVRERFLRGDKKAIWFSVAKDLHYDACRDLNHVEFEHSKDRIRTLSEMDYRPIGTKSGNKFPNGVLFSTYSGLIGKQTGGAQMTRLKQIIDWAGPDYEGLKAKNLMPSKGKPSKTAESVIELQRQLPKARVVYCSATGASEASHMAYMDRCGLWGPGTPFEEGFSDFLVAVKRRGVGAMECVAMDMKALGGYIARTLSYEGASFDVCETKVDDAFTRAYDDSVAVWNEAREVLSSWQSTFNGKHDRLIQIRLYWAAHQRFFRYFCIGSKLPKVIELAKAALDAGKCVVIGLQGTGEARINDKLDTTSDDSLDDFVSAPREVLDKLLMTCLSRLTGVSPEDLRKGRKTIIEEPPLASPFVSTQVGAMRGSPDSAPTKRAFEVDEASSDERDYEDDFDMRATKKMRVTDSGASKRTAKASHGNSDYGKGRKSKEMPVNRSSGQRRSSRLNPAANVKGKGKSVYVEPTSSSSSSAEWDGSVTELSDVATTEEDEEDQGDDSDGKDEGESKDADEGEDMCRESLKATERASRSHNKEKVDASSGLSPSILACLEKIDQFMEIFDSVDMPRNPLDVLIDALGGPSNVAELTGRRGQCVRDPRSGRVIYRPRNFDVAIDQTNMFEKNEFLEGRKLVAIISEAASAGISLHADKSVNNKRTRYHMTLEVPWSAEQCIQQLGRTHRSNQVCAPEYVFVISEIGGERRFASAVASRLESLGALTKGDRKANAQTRDLAKYNFETKYGKAALKKLWELLVSHENMFVSWDYDALPDFITPEYTLKAFLNDAYKALDDVGYISHMTAHQSDVTTFGNRILGVPLLLQNRIFATFTAIMDSVLLRARRDGSFDEGIVDVGCRGEHVTIRGEAKVVRVTDAMGAEARTLHYTFDIDRGFSWEQAESILSDHKNRFRKEVGEEDRESGFFVGRSELYESYPGVAIKVIGTNSFRILRPSTGWTEQKTRKDVNSTCKFARTPASLRKTRADWENIYKQTERRCLHLARGAACTNYGCTHGMRRTTVHVMAGCILPVWKNIDRALNNYVNKLRIMRITTSDGQRVVGLDVPDQYIARALGAINNKDVPLLPPSGEEASGQSGRGRRGGRGSRGSRGGGSGGSGGGVLPKLGRRAQRWQRLMEQQNSIQRLSRDISRSLDPNVQPPSAAVPASNGGGASSAPMRNSGVLTLDAMLAIVRQRAHRTPVTWPASYD